MSKYRTMSVPDQQPGKCANCGASKPDGRSYVDFGLLIPWYGTVFLCSTCLEDIARNVGLFDEIQKKLAFANKQASEIQELITQGKALEKGLNEGYEGVKEYFNRLCAFGNESSSDFRVGLESNKESNKQAAGEGNSASNEAKQRTAKSTSGSRPKDILSLAERLQLDK